MKYWILLKSFFTLINEIKNETKNINTRPNVSRLLISLAQLKAGNNSEKLENEIKRKLLNFCISQKV